MVSSSIQIDTLEGSERVHELRRYVFEVFGFYFLEMVGIDSLQFQVHFAMEVGSPLVQVDISTYWVFNMIVLK